VGFRGQLVIPEDFGRSLSGAERTSLFKRQAVGILKNHRFDFLYPEKKEFSLNHFFSILREKVFNSSRQFWEDDNLGLALAFLTGDKSQLSLELKKIINCLGLAHLIAVSGMQFTSLGFLLEAGLFFLNFPHKVRFYLIMAVLLFFLLFIGAPAAASRAFLMDFLNRLAVRCGRKITFWASFLFSASLLLLFNPWSLFYDLGFLFSFFAIWGLYFFGDFFRIQSLPTALQESLALNLAAQTATAPLALFYFPYFSPLSVVVNLLVGWLAIPLIVLSFGALLLAPLFLPLAELLSSCATCLVFYFVLILEKIKSISWSCLSLENNMFWAGVFFAVVALLAFGLKIFNLKEKNEKDRFFSVG
jgi:competence protein ComEC